MRKDFNLVRRITKSNYNISKDIKKIFALLGFDKQSVFLLTIMVVLGYGLFEFGQSSNNEKKKSVLLWKNGDDVVYKDFLYSDNKYEIIAENQENIDLMNIILNDLGAINPLCAGFVKDLEKSKQTILILPDTATIWFHKPDAPWVDAFFSNGVMYFSDKYLKYYKQEKTINNNESFNLNNVYGIILHEGRHGQQWRHGLIQKSVKFYKKNLFDYICANGWIEADAAMYSRICLLPDISEKNINEYSNDLLYQAYYLKEFQNISHLINPKEIDDFKSSDLDTVCMKEFFDLLKSLNVVIYNNKKIEYLKGGIFPCFILDYKKLYRINSNPNNENPPKSVEKYINNKDNIDENMQIFGNDSTAVKDFFMTLLRQQRPDLFKNNIMVNPGKIRD